MNNDTVKEAAGALRSPGAAAIAIERDRHDYTPEHDDTHTKGELVEMVTEALLYKSPTSDRFIEVGEDELKDADGPELWGRRIVAKRKPYTETLAILGSLIAAEIDRVKRLENRPPVSGSPITAPVEGHPEDIADAE